jgi:hypothetical protein
VRVTLFRRTRGPARPPSGLLRNYLARAQAIAAAGGGNLWLIEPTLTSAAMPAFTAAVARHLTDNGVVTGDLSVLEGRTSARICILGAPTVEIVLPKEHLTPPTSYR